MQLKQADLFYGSHKQIYMNVNATKIMNQISKINVLPRATNLLLVLLATGHPAENLSLLVEPR